MDYLLGIDLGTSGVKSIITDTEGCVQGVGLREYGLDMPRPGWAEQHPRTWVDAAAAASREAIEQAGVDPSGVVGIGLSGQMHTTVCLDARGNLLRPAITWADQRSKPQVEEVYQRLGKATLARWAQNPLAAGFTLATLLWLQENEADTYRSIGHVLLPKDYLRYYLTGEIGTEATDAAATLLMDVAQGEWNLELLDTCGVNPHVLPAISRSIDVAGRLLPDAAAAFGLPGDIPVVYGCGDQPAHAVGNAVIEPGILSSTIGTGGQLFAPSLTPAYDPELRLHTFWHAVPGTWYIMAATLSAGLSFNWLRRVLQADSYELLADAAAAAPPGSDGLFFLPYLAGERTPHMSPDARGVFAGLTLRHGREHMARAVMEGVVFSLRQGLGIIEGLGVPIERVVASGGGTRHPLWLQLQADIFNRRIYRTSTEEAGAFGAALLAGVGVGIYPTVAAACAQAVRPSELAAEPDPAAVERYSRAYDLFARLYPALSEFFDLDAETL